ncbi:MAG TPA: SOS response-associated peptidase [Candidatus Limnocylindria bacterium]|nr:SOS response-associated peptidase [Candidatus Limnocylindria bacterium]
MCGRFVQERSHTELAGIFEAEPITDDPGGRFNVAPTDPASVVVQRDDRRALTIYRWGLIPHWATDPSIGTRHINARAETLATSRAFRESFARRRCIVPADGFYEWLRLNDRRQPFVIRRADDAPLGLAGLWSGWRDPSTGQVRRTFAIVTTQANAAVARLHDRMPVVLPRDAWATWLDPRPAEIGELQALLQPAPEDWLEIFAVRPLVNNVRNDGPGLVRRLDPQPDLNAPEETLGLQADG